MGARSGRGGDRTGARRSARGRRGHPHALGLPPVPALESLRGGRRRHARDRRDPHRPRGRWRARARGLRVGPTRGRRGRAPDREGVRDRRPRGRSRAGGARRPARGRPAPGPHSGRGRRPDRDPGARAAPGLARVSAHGSRRGARALPVRDAAHRARSGEGGRGRSALVPGVSHRQSRPVARVRPTETSTAASRQTSATSTKI